MSDKPESGANPGEIPDFLVGPFTYYKVLVDGRVIPRLTGCKVDDHLVELVVDGRFAATFTVASARSAAWLIAEAMAIGAGYSHLGALTPGMPFAPTGAQIGSIGDDEPDHPYNGGPSPDDAPVKGPGEVVS